MLHSSSICEKLESRQLLSVVSYLVPAGHTAAYLQPGAVAGQVVVRLDSPSNPIVQTFSNTTGTDFIACGNVTNFLFVDQVPAADKPIADASGNQGIKVQGGNKSTLEIDSGPDDTNIHTTGKNDGDIFAIESDDSIHTAAGIDTIATGISQVTLRTNDAGGTTIYIPGLNLNIALDVDTGKGTNDTITLGDNNSIDEQVTLKTGAGHDTVNLQPSGGGTLTNALIDFGAGTGTGNGLGLGNTLNIRSSAIATLMQDPGSPSHVIAVDNINVSDQGGNLVVADPSTIGDLEVNAGGEAQIESASTIPTLDVKKTGKVFFDPGSTIGAINNDGTVEFAPGSGKTIVDKIQGGGNVNVDIGNDVLLKESSQIGALEIDPFAKLTLQSREASPSSAGPRSLAVKSLNLIVEDQTTITGTLDLTDNDLIVDYTTSSPYSTIKSLLTSGYNHRTWTGDGIVSSTAAAVLADPNNSHKTTLGFAEASDFGITSFSGISVDSTAVLIGYTWEGDANLDGKVDVTDLGILMNNWQESGDWRNADFNYDGTVDITDLGLLANNWQQGVGNSLQTEIIAASQSASRKTASRSRVAP